MQQLLYGGWVIACQAPKQTKCSLCEHEHQVAQCKSVPHAQGLLARTHEGLWGSADQSRCKTAYLGIAVHVQRVAFENVVLQDAWGLNFRRNVFLPLSGHPHVDLGLDNAQLRCRGMWREDGDEFHARVHVARIIMPCGEH